MAAIEKSLRESAARDYLRAAQRGDKLQIQLAEAQSDARSYKRKLRRSHHKLQLAETNFMAE